jgi:hypothetical protein
VPSFPPKRHSSSKAPTALKERKKSTSPLRAVQKRGTLSTKCYAMLFILEEEVSQHNFS